jgi:hypothetical protein
VREPRGLEYYQGGVLLSVAKVCQGFLWVFRCHLLILKVLGFHLSAQGALITTRFEVDGIISQAMKETTSHNHRVRIILKSVRKPMVLPSRVQSIDEVTVLGGESREFVKA